MQQQSLFHTEETKPYGETQRDRMHALAQSEQVKADVMAVFRAHAGKFIFTNNELYAVNQKYDLGSYFNDTLRCLERDGLLERRNVYNGASSPVGTVTDLAGKRARKKGDKQALPYLGYTVEYRAKEVA